MTGAAVACTLVCLCPPLVRWLGTKKLLQLLGATGLFAMLTGCAIKLRWEYTLAEILSRDFFDGTYLLCLISGIALALAFTGGDKPGETFHLRLREWIMPALLLLATYVCIILNKYGFVSIPQCPDEFFFLYTLSVGAFGGLWFSWQNQVVTNRGVFDQTRVLPPYEKTKLRQYPGTLCLLGIIAAIAVIGVATVPRQHLIDTYGNAGFGAWLRYIFLSWFFNWDMRNVMRWTGVNIETLLQGQLWRLFTVDLLHFGPLHLLGNGAALYFAGKYIEPRIGTLKWLGVFYGAVWAAKLPVLFYTDALTSGGASIGIYALVAVFLLFAFKKDEMIRIRPYAFVYLLGYVFVGEFLSHGHFGSFVCGLAAALAMRRPRRRQEKK